MKKTILILTATALSVATHAAVPLKWTVETSRIQPAAFDVVRGESLALEASFNSYGKPLEMGGKECRIFWQTNGMGTAWWTGPATAVSNRMSATFAPTMDPGGATVRGFLGATGDIYRAEFTLRFRHGPGALPNVITMPPPVLDFAHTVVINPPWPTQEVSPQGVTNIVKGTVSDWAWSENEELFGKMFSISVQEMIDENIETNNLCTLAAARDMSAVRLERGTLNWMNQGMTVLSLGGTFYPIYVDVADFGHYRSNGYPLTYFIEEKISLTSVTNGGAKAYTDAATNGLATAASATNTAISVVSNHLEYALRELSGASVSLLSGEIGNVTLDAATTNLSVSLAFPSEAGRAGDCLLWVENATNVTLRVGNEDVAAVGWDGADLKAGTNLVMFTRIKRDGQRSVVLVSTREVK